MQEDSLREMIHCLAQYPPETVFFLDTWCWGWEEVIVAVAKAFRTKVSNILQSSLTPGAHRPVQA